MKKKLIGLLLAGVLLLSGCIKNNSVGQESNESMSDESQSIESQIGTKVDYQYGFGIEGLPEGRTIKYDGSPINLKCFVDNTTGKGFEAGILIFVDGVIQEYYDSVNNINGYNHFFNVREKVYEEYDISFVPQKGKAGDTLTVRFLCVLNPRVIPTSENYDFAHNTSMMKIMPITLQILKDVEESKTYADMKYVLATDMTSEQYDEKMRDNSGRYRNRLNDINFDLTGPNNTLDKFYDKDNKIHMFIDGYGGSSEEYVLIAFINGISVDYKDFGAIYQIKEGKFLTQSELVLDLDLLDASKYSLSKYNSLSIMAIPASDKAINMPYKIRTRLFMYSN